MARRKRNQNAESSKGLSGRKRSAIFGLIALVAGGACIVIVNQMITSFREQIEHAKLPPKSATVVLAAHDLYQGMPITTQDIALVEFPLEFLPGGNTDLVYTNPQELIGRVPRERILANEFVRDDRLADAERGVGLNGLIEKGSRAISVGISNDKALSGFLHPKDYVDVLVTINNRDDGDEIIETHTIAQALYVLAVNGLSGAEEAPVDASRAERAQVRQRSTAPSVTLHVTPQQAEAIAYAEREGKIHLSLRNKADVTALALSHVDTRSITGEVKEQPKAAPPRRTTPKTTPEPVETGPTIRMIRGGQVTEREVQDGSSGSN